MTQIKNCGQCEQVRFRVMKPMTIRLYYCGLLPFEGGMAVPQSGSERDRQTTFKRVPMQCPRTTREVMKTEGPQKRWRNWTTIDWDTEETRPALTDADFAHPTGEQL